MSCWWINLKRSVVVCSAPKGQLSACLEVIRDKMTLAFRVHFIG